MSCLDENLALDFLSGRMTPAAVAEAERHLAECGNCVDLLALSAPLLHSRPPTGPAGGARLRAAPGSGGSSSGGRGGKDPRTDETERGPRPPFPADLAGGGDAALAPGTRLKDTYEVRTLIGRGGMGEVYEVSHARLAGRYALKLLPAAFSLDPAAVTRFRREAEITSALRHPGIVQVIDFDHTPDGQPFLVMEYLDGGDLGQLMATAGAMPLARVLAIAGQIVSALAAVHRQGIVHRDLKPQNVLLVGDDANTPDQVKLADFGLSKRRQGSLLDLRSTAISRERTLLGTPRYMAPEQAAGRIDDIDASTDQFALGTMVYEMLAGAAAFDDEHPALMLHHIVYEEPKPLTALLPGLPAEVDAAVARAMSKKQSDRFAVIGDFFEALRGGVVAPPVDLTTKPARPRAMVSSTSSPSSLGPVSAPPRSLRRSAGFAVLGAVAAAAVGAAVVTLPRLASHSDRRSGEAPSAPVAAGAVSAPAIALPATAPGAPAVPPPAPGAPAPPAAPAVVPPPASIAGAPSPSPSPSPSPFWPALATSDPGPAATAPATRSPGVRRRRVAAGAAAPVASPPSPTATANGPSSPTVGRLVEDL